MLIPKRQSAAIKSKGALTSVGVCTHLQPQNYFLYFNPHPKIGFKFAEHIIPH